MIAINVSNYKNQPSLNKAVVVWLKYCRYGLKHKKIDESVFLLDFWQ